MDEPVRTSVVVYGEEYQLKGDLPEEVVLALAHHVDNRMRVLAAKNPRVSPLRLAVVTAMNLTEEIFRLQAERDELVQTMQQKWRRRDAK